ncbi:MAG: hypothetical protein V1837_07310 [Candidatus Woesearchaeota archaeon]
MKRTYLVLALIFAFSVALRLFFALSVQNFSDNEAYFVLRQVESIRQTGLPLYHDPLSYDGKQQIFLPLYYYSLSIFSFFLPVQLVLKIIPNLFASCLVFVVYAITLHITRNPAASLWAASVSAVIPVFTSLTANSASIYTFVVPLLFLILYFFMRAAQEKAFVWFFVISFFTLAFTSAIAALVALGFVFYLLIAKLEGLRTTKAELEVTIFSVLFILWLYVLVFKKILLTYGASVLFQNIPSALMSQYFRNITIVGAVNQVGLLPLFVGTVMLYHYLFRIKSKSIYMLIGFTFAVFLLLWLKVLSFGGGLMVLGSAFTILFGKSLASFLDYIEKTNLLRFKMYFAAGAVILLVASSLGPTLFYYNQESKKAFNADEIDALQWLANNSEPQSVVLSTLQEGNLVTGIAHRADVMDQNFLLVPNIDQRLSDLDTIFSTSSEIEAVDLLTKFHVDYIFFSDYAKLKYKRTSLGYTDDFNCFQLVYDKQVQIYRTRCKLETIT